MVIHIWCKCNVVRRFTQIA